MPAKMKIMGGHSKLMGSRNSKTVRSNALLILDRG